MVLKRHDTRGRPAVGWASGLAILVGASTALVSPALAQARAQDFQISPMTLAKALLEYSRQTQVDVMAPSQLLDGKQSSGVQGQMTRDEALSRLLQGSGLKAVEQADSTVIITPISTSSALPAASSELRLAQAEPVAPPVAPPAAASTEPVLDEVIVTATFRDERLQDVPIAISALSNDRLTKMGAENFQDFARTIPGVSFVDLGPSHNKIVIRGITTTMAFEANATTSMYFDDTPVGSSSSNPDLKVFDIERVEVLRGPQGTLFGDAAMGGTIRYVTAKADPTRFATKTEGFYSSTSEGGGNWGANAMVNLPLVDDRLALRVAGYYRDYAGFVDALTVGGRDVNDEQTVGGRASLRWLVNDAFTLNLSVLHQSSEHGGRNTVTPSLADLQQAFLFRETLKDEFTITNLTAEFDLSFATLNSSTSYQQRDLHELRDYSLVIPTVTSLEDLGSPKGLFSENRLVSKNPGRFDWLIGTYITRSISGLPQRIITYPASGGSQILSRGLKAENRVTQFASYGELGFNATERLKLTAGLRWYDINQDIHLITTGPRTPAPPGGIFETRTNARFSGFIPKYSAAFKFSEANMVYAQMAKGFRLGGPTAIGFPPDLDGTPAPTQYDPDSLWNYELGFKSAWLDGKLALNAALFYVDWEGLQTGVIRLDNRFLTTNAGSATSEGAELEVLLRPFNGLELSLSGAWVDSTLAEDRPPPNDGLEGDQMPGVPQKTYAASARYTFPVAGEWAAFGQGNWQYVGGSTNGFQRAFASGLNADYQPSYDLSSIRAGLQSDRYEVSVFVENLFDERPVLFVDRILGGLRHHTARPRTIGLWLKANY